MSRHPALVIYKKELLDTLRDRRTLAAMLLVPMVAYPVALLVTSETIAVERRAVEVRPSHVALLTPLPTMMEDALRATPGLAVATATTVGPLRALTIADVALAMSATHAAAFDGVGTGSLSLYFDGSRPYADAAVTRVEKAIETINADRRAARMQAASLPVSAADPLRLVRTSVASDEDVASQLLGSLLPALVLLFVAISCFYPAVDLTAGEKERRTLATLLTAPVPTRHVVWGKYLAVVTIGTIAGLLNVTTLALTLARVLAAEPTLGPLAFELTVPVVIQIGVAVLSLAAPLASIMLLFACFARSFRDASFLLTPVLLVAAVPAVVSSLPGFLLSPKMAFVPLANAALLMKAAFGEGTTPLLLAVVLVVSLATTRGLLALVERVFADERVLFSTGGPRANVRALLFAPPRAGVESALALGGLVFVAQYYAGLVFGALSPLASVAVTQILANGLLAYAWARWMRATDLLALSSPTSRGLGAGVLTGAGAWLGVALPAAWLTAALVPGQSAAADAFSAALDLRETPIALIILVLAVLPAVMEELLFRGAIFGLLSRAMTSGSVVLAQAVVFGLFHASVYRFLPTALLGLALGELRRRTGSIVPGIVAHAMTNATLILIDGYAPEIANTLAEPTGWALLGLGLLFGAHLAVDSRRKKGVDHG